MLNKTVFLIATLVLLGVTMAGPAFSAGDDDMTARLEKGKAIAFNETALSRPRGFAFADLGRGGQEPQHAYAAIWP